MRAARAERLEAPSGVKHARRWLGTWSPSNLLDLWLPAGPPPELVDDVRTAADRG